MSIDLLPCNFERPLGRFVLGCWLNSSIKSASFLKRFLVMTEPSWNPTVVIRPLVSNRFAVLPGIPGPWIVQIERHSLPKCSELVEHTKLGEGQWKRLSIEELTTASPNCLANSVFVSQVSGPLYALPAYLHGEICMVRLLARY